MNQITVLVVACIVAFVAAECPSACSGHGTCGAYDACTCFRNWMSNDCSERICPFGLAHVDTPLGDLDASSGALTGPGSTGSPGSGNDLSIIVNDAMYPQGTTEQFPAMKDSGGTVTTESAHYYRECSNKGICDRSSGECECFDGYDGSACQRASCPSSSNGVCSGHGVCKTIQELAADDNENIYRLWDEDVTMGCDCDPGYEGADCASRACKVGVDPLYSDDFANVRHANYTLQFYIMNDDAEIYGNYSLVFTDVYGEDWQTEPIDIDANCATIQDRLETLPNDVIPWGTVKCYKSEESLHVGSSTGEQPSAASGLTELSKLSQETDKFLSKINAAITSATISDLVIGTYTDVALTGGTAGAGGKATIVVDSTSSVSAVTVTNDGSGYAAGETITIAANALGTGSSEFTFDIGSANSGDLKFAGEIGGNTNDPSASGQKASEAVRTFSGAQYSTETATVGELIYSAFNYSVVNKFVLAFPGNPGEIPPLKVNRFLDGKRPTLFSTEKELQTIGVHIYANGFHGETTDYVNDECEGVLVSLASDQVQHAAGVVADTGEKLSHYLKISDNLDFERLKKCLGDADGIKDNNVEVYDWDYGNFINPHLIKLVDATQDRYTEYLRADGSSYKVLAHGDTPIGTGEGWESFPMTKLCARGDPWLHDNYESSPKHKLLFQADVSDSVTSGGEVYNRGTHGWCKNPNPPGFYAIIYFDDCSANGVTAQTGYLSASDTDTSSSSAVAKKDGCAINMKGFRVLSRAALDYDSNTKFHVYTTKGTLQQVSQHSGAYTATYQEKYNPHDGSNRFGTLNPDFIHNFHSRVIHVVNTTFTGAQGQIDCETAPVGTYGNFDCLNKGDKVFLLNLGDRQTDCESARSGYTNIAGGSIGSSDSCYYKSTPLSFDTNPYYLNMYTVEKIGKAVKNPNEADSRHKFWGLATGDSEYYNDHNSIHHEGYRNQITLNMGVNTQYMSNLAGASSSTLENEESIPDLKATIYKFHPPTLASTGTTGYNYVGACSNRGICNSDDGICECFDGFTNDNCDTIDSLAK